MRHNRTEPEIQNIPVRTEDGARIKAAFTQSPLVTCDFADLELRVLAWYKSNDS